MHAYFVECNERTFAEQGLEARHPLLDKRLIEFALNIPDGQRVRHGCTKFVLRAALDGWLADAVRHRRSKADFSHIIADALGVLNLAGDLWIARAGWVDGAVLSEMYSRALAQYAAGAQEYSNDIATLWMIAAVEVWYRSAFHAPAAAL